MITTSLWTQHYGCFSDIYVRRTIDPKQSFILLKYGHVQRCVAFKCYFLYSKIFMALCELQIRALYQLTEVFPY